MARPSHLLMAPLLLALAACASTPGEVSVPMGGRVLVRLYDSRSGAELALANESHPELADVYSSKRSKAVLKLAPDELMADLLTSLEREGLSRYARSDDEPPQSGSWLLVDHGDQHQLMVQPGSNGSVDERQAWGKLKLLVGYYYQHVSGLQYVENPDGASIFGEQR